MAMKSMEGVAQRYSQFAARVVLPFDQTPSFPARCLGCDELLPKRKWTPPSGVSPFAGNAQYYGNHGMLPPIEIPVCDICYDHMPGRTQELSGWIASYLAPLLLACASLFFYTVQLYALTALTGAACLVWIFIAMRAVWVVDHSTLFDLQASKNDTLIYYFRDPEYATEFNRLNE